MLWSRLFLLRIARDRQRKRRSSRTSAHRFRRLAGWQSLEPRLFLAGDLVGNWLAQDLNGLADGAVVTSWTDSVTSIPGIVEGQPKLIKHALGGRSVVRFDASDGADVIRVAARQSPLRSAGDFTVAVVFVTASKDLQGTNGNWYENTGLVDSSNLGFAQDWGISLNQAGQIAAGLGAGFGQPSRTVYSSLSGLNDGQPHVAIVSRTGGTISIYVDGNATGSRPDGSAAPRANDVDLVIGAIQSGVAPFTGDIAELRIYNGAVTAAEAANLHATIRAFYNNTPPTARNDEYSTPEDPLLFAVSAARGVLANDEDVNGDPLTAQLVDSVQHGTLSVNSDGSFAYAPDADYFGRDSFTYTANDFRPSNVAVVTINVTNVYDPATPVADTYKALAGRAFSVDAASGVLANDQNPDGTTLRAVLDQQVGAGSLTLGQDGSFRYDPAGFAGATRFSYRINDGTQTSASQTVALIINTPPVVGNDHYDVVEDVRFTPDAARGVMANDRDAEGDPLSAQLITEPAHGTLVFQPDGSFAYEPAANYFGPDAFTYKLADWTDESEAATVNLNVIAVDDPPIARPNVFFGAAGATLTKSANESLLVNDTDIDSPSLSAVLVAGPQHGTLNLRADGSFSYTPNAGFSGTDTFSYRASDTTSMSEIAEVRLLVGTSPLRVSELLTANASSLATRTRPATTANFAGDLERYDYVELQNLTNVPFDVGGFHLTDDPDAPKKWRIPEGTLIPASGYLVIFASRLNITDPALDELGLLHTNFTLRVEGEYLAVTAPDGFVLHSLDPYPRQVPDVSFGTTAAGTTAYFVTATPGQANSSAYAGVVSDPEFSVGRGFYTEPFPVSIRSATPDVRIRYTTDGSAPTETTGQDYTSPINVTTTTTLRAAAFKAGHVPSPATTHTYLFIADVIRQDNSPPGFPAEWVGDGGRGKVPADYEMDPEITQNPAYRDIIDDALLAIPTISIVTDLDNLFDPRTGIYQQPEKHGRDWERPASVELIFPDGTLGFQVNAGLRIQGGENHTRMPSGSPKHSFRLRFRGVYGTEKLRYDWFGGESVDEFDTIVLRAGGNQSWIHTNTFSGDDRGRAQYIRDLWAKDTQLAMGHIASHGSYAHLYVNGIYWGLYNPTERPTAAFAASYLGGTEDEYDVLNVGVPLDGDSVAWRDLQQKARGLGEDANYQAFSKLLDIDAFIDYMILNHYGGNLDWDSHNWYAIRRREPDGKFLFVPWDSEYIFIRNSDNLISVRQAAPGRLFRELRNNAEFRMKLADHIQRHFFHDGLLTPKSVVERWEARSNQIVDAIVAESARWGDYRRDVLRSAGPFELLERDVQWIAERNRLLNDYFPVRTGIVLDQYRQAELFPSIDAPTFSQRGGAVSSQSDIVLSSAEGIIYYTTDGSDPRLASGGISPTAIRYTGAFRLSRPATVRTRVLSGDQWSAIDEAEFVVDIVPADASNLRISEINYHPGNPTDDEIAAGHDNADDFEFVELVNISDRRIDLTNVRFQQTDVDGDSQGVAFDFATSSVTFLEAGQHLVVVEDEDAFAFRYGHPALVAGQWSGGLSNGGEQITLRAGEIVIHQFAYADDWFPATDGGGFTLEIIDPATSRLDSWGQKASWNSSGRIGGSPGSSSSLPIPGDSNHDGLFNSSDLVLVFQASEYEDIVPHNSTFEDGDWNGDGDFTTSDFVVAFQAGTFVHEAIGRTPNAIYFSGGIHMSRYALASGSRGIHETGR
jgi:hypothetical protein